MIYPTIDPNEATRTLRAYSLPCPSIELVACHPKMNPTIKTMVAIQIKIIPMIKAMKIPKFPIRNSPMMITLSYLKCS